jgi:hypothetical protein
MSKSAETVTIYMMVHVVTAKAVLVSDDGDKDNSVWLPLSQLTFEGELKAGKTVHLTMPEWLAFEKDLS